VIELTGKGLPLREVRATIDARWAKAGPPTDTTFPP
jgi:hypothetical protein